MRNIALPLVLSVLLFFVFGIYALIVGAYATGIAAVLAGVAQGFVVRWLLRG